MRALEKRSIVAKPKNEKTMTDIVDAAWSLFVAEGYKKTSYEAISKYSGVPKPLVQHYFPKKEELLLSSIMKLRGAAADEVHKIGGASDDPMRRFYLTGQVYLQALLSTEGSRRFFAEMLDSRSLTSSIMDFDFEWSLDELDSQREVSSQWEAYRDRNIELMGGFYELLYRRLCSHDPIDVPSSMRRVMAGIMVELGRTESEAMRDLDLWTLADAELAKLGRRALEDSLAERAR